MNILFASSELAPFTGAGQSGEGIRALAAGLQGAGHDVSVVVPFYRAARESGGAKARRTGAKFSVPVGGNSLSCEIREVRAAEGYQVFFVERDEFFDRSGLYGVDGRDYQDNSARFTFFAKCVLEVARRMDPAPDVVHAHNWQSALVPVFAANQNFSARTVLSTDTLEFQGNFWSYDFGLTNLPGEYFSPRGLEYYGSLNFLKGGMLAAEAIVVPGPRFAAAIQTEEHACGLLPVTREQSGKIEGISAGLDAAAWNPATDSKIAKRYKTPDGKRNNRKAWMTQAGLKADNGGPNILVATAAGASDGLALLLPALDRIVEGGANVVVAGPVAESSVAGLLAATRQHAGRVAWLPEVADGDEVRPALAGSDIFLVPAQLEPRADLVRKALRYGVIPVCLASRGLASLVPAFRPGSPDALGFAVHLATPDAVTDALRFAVGIFRNRAEWNEMVTRAMSVDIGWSATAEAHARLYEILSGRRRARRAA